MKKRKQHGFTLVELVVITGILVLCGGLIAGIIFNTLRGSRKSANTNSSTQSGNFALSSITAVVDKSDQVVSSCNNQSAQSIQLYNSQNDSLYTISCQTGNTITIAESKRTTGVTVGPPVVLLNSGAVLATGSCSIICSQASPSVTGAASPNPFMKPLIRVSFGITDPDQNTATFKTSILLRNYEP